MLANNKVSIIVPFYNVGQSIYPTLDSLFSQTYLNIEIILVDDGSSDASYDFVHQYILKDSRAKILKISNSGPGFARLQGFLKSTGNYIFFLDADDVIHPKTIEIMVNSLRSNNSDIAISNYITVNSKERLFKENIENNIVNLSKADLIREISLCGKIQNFLWGKLYRRDILFEEDFDTKKRLGEDISTMYRIMNRCESGLFIDGSPLVFYYTNPNSLSRKLAYSKLNDYCDALIEKTNFIKEFYPEFYSLTFNANIDYFFLIEINFDRNRIFNIDILFEHIAKSCLGIKNRLKLLLAKHPLLANKIIKKRKFEEDCNLKKIAVINTYNKFSTGSIAKSIMDGVSNTFESRLFYGRCKDVYDNESIYFGGNRIYSLMNNIFVKLSGKIGCAHKRNTKRLIKMLDKFNPDIIHLHNIHGNYLNYKMLLDYLSDKRVVITMHDCFWLTGRCAHFINENAICYEWKNGCKKCPNKNFYMSSLIFDHARNQHELKKHFLLSSKHMRLIALSTWQQMLFSDYRTFLIPNGFSFNNNLLNKKIAETNKTILIGVSQNWTKSKGIDDINYFAEKLDPKLFEIKLIGRIPKNQRINRNIKPLGTLEKKEIIHEVSSADLFINPTYIDTFPSVLVESLACGTPIVSYDVGGCSDIVGDCGVLVECGNKDDFLNSIISFKLEDYNTSKIFARAKLFEKQKMVENYMHIYEELLNE